MWKTVITRYGTICLLLAYGLPVADATCSWILWQRVTKLLEVPGAPRVWEVQQTFVNRSACTQHIKASLEELKQRIEKYSSSLGPSDITVGMEHASGYLIRTPQKARSNDDFGSTTKLWCLPDTVDPRK
jgi:hypothetical protein